MLFLPEFKSSDMQRKATNVFTAAYEGPVIITRQGAESVVMLSKEKYSELVALARQSKQAQQ